MQSDDVKCCKATRIFNKFFSGFLRDIKELHEDLKSAVKASYHVIDKSSNEYCEYFKDHVYMCKGALVDKNFEDEELVLKNVCKGVTVGDIFKHCVDETQKNLVINSLLILTLFAWLTYDDDVTLNVAVELLGLIQRGESEQYMKRRNDVFDDNLQEILDAIHDYGGKTRVDVENASVEAEETRDSSTSEGDGTTFDPSTIFEQLSNSKIADLAKEISKDIDVSSLKAENPDDLLKNLFTGNGEQNVLGNIISKVSNTLNEKITNGELKHEDLLSEAMSMMSMFGGKQKGSNPMASILGEMTSNPMFSQIAKAMQGGKASIRQDVIRKASTRDRLRKKLDERRQDTSKNVE